MSGGSYAHQESLEPMCHQHCEPQTSPEGSSTNPEKRPDGEQVMCLMSGWVISTSLSGLYGSPLWSSLHWSRCCPGVRCPEVSGMWAGPPPPGRRLPEECSTFVSTPMAPSADPRVFWFEWPPPLGSPRSETAPCDHLRLQLGSARTCPDNGG